MRPIGSPPLYDPPPARPPLCLFPIPGALTADDLKVGDQVRLRGTFYYHEDDRLFKVIVPPKDGTVVLHRSWGEDLFFVAYMLGLEPGPDGLWDDSGCHLVRDTSPWPPEKWR
jgi:hypothetical protein